jgi:tRNA modification GTPase
MTDTICALATAPGGALGIIRVSGPQAFDAVSAISSVDCASAAANTVHFTRLVAPAAVPASPIEPLLSDAVLPHHDEVIDEALVTIFRAPHSYTGEDSVEISCHGSRYILNKVLELLIANGCRMAEPGEYTMRAYLNGKMDLSQAEAVADLIASTNQATHQMAISQLRGHFSSRLAQLREQLLKLTSLLELELDFSDHEDLEFADRSELLTLAKNIDTHISQLAKSFETGQAIKQGIPVAIVGKTNVGKSTLLNRLLKDDRAIVSDVHGTTRDTIEDTIDINGITFRFIDTAGIRQTTDQVEQIGIERTYAAIDKARIVIWIIDEEPSQEELNKMLVLSDNKQLIIVRNKIDKAENRPFTLVKIPLIEISAKQGTHLSDLEQAIYKAADIPTLSAADVIVTNARHYEALTRAHTHLQRVLAGLGAEDSSPLTTHSSLPPDLVAEDLRQTLDALAEITGGQITPHEVLGNIFKNFCVGK